MLTFLTFQERHVISPAYLLKVQPSKGKCLAHQSENDLRIEIWICTHLYIYIYFLIALFKRIVCIYIINLNLKKHKIYHVNHMQKLDPDPLAGLDRLGPRTVIPLICGWSTGSSENTVMIPMISELWRYGNISELMHEIWALFNKKKHVIVCVYTLGLGIFTYPGKKSLKMV